MATPTDEAPEIFNDDGAYLFGSQVLLPYRLSELEHSPAARDVIADAEADIALARAARSQQR